MSKSQSELGTFYTEGDPFDLTAFVEFARVCGLSEGVPSVIEPFAGSNNLIRLLGERYKFDSLSFDLDPQSDEVFEWDTIKQFPPHWHNYPRVVVTNPPWLAKNSAKRQGLAFPATTHDNIYKLCLDRCLDNVLYVAALVPSSFIHSNFECRRRLLSYTLIHDSKFFSTEHPTALVCFGKETYEHPSIYYDDECLGNLDELRSFMPAKVVDRNIKANVSDGVLGLKVFDGLSGNNPIEFCHGYDLPAESISSASRHYTRFSLDLSANEISDLGGFIAKANDVLLTYRTSTRDALLTTFKGMDSLGKFRRRITYKEAARFLNSIEFTQ